MTFLRDDNQTPLLSIVVPVFNVERHVNRCLNSLTKQSYKNIEIIVVDDGSTDCSGDICDWHACKDARIKVVHQANQGLSKARNVGIDLACGRYVVFVDSDDYLNLDACDLIANAANAGADVIVSSPLSLWPRQKRTTKLNSGSTPCICTGTEYMLHAYRSNTMRTTPWSYVCRLDFLRDYGLRFKEGALYEGTDFVPRLLAHADSVIALDHSYYHYSRRRESITNTKQQNAAFGDIYATCLQLESLADNFDNELRSRFKAALVKYYLFVFRKTSKSEECCKAIDKSFVARNATKHLDFVGRSCVRLFLLSPTLCRIGIRIAIGAKELIYRGPMVD